MICEEWLRDIDSFISFALSNGWSESLQIDRIDNDGDYEPNNVRFVTSKENSRNRRNKTLIEIDGVTRMLCEWSDISGVGRATIAWRYKNGIRGIELLESPHSVEINGVRKPTKEWADSIGVPVDTFRKRINDGLVGDKLLQPLRNTGPQRKE